MNEPIDNDPCECTCCLKKIIKRQAAELNWLKLTREEALIRIEQLMEEHKLRDWELL